MKVNNFINGKWVSSKDFLNSVSPENGEIIGTAPLSSPDDVSQAIEAAKIAFPEWSKTPISERSKYLIRTAEIIEEEYGKAGEATPLKKLLSKEMGKRLAEADIEVIESCDMLRFFAEQGMHSLADRPIALDRELWPTKKSTIHFQPLGIVGIIKPWNYPLELPLWSIGVALMAGNTVVFKPSELTPLVASKIIEFFHKAKLPKGVLNMVTGDGSTGQALIEHPDVTMISFTGSVPVGKQIALKCAEQFKHVSLELGGKDAMIVLADADLDLAVEGALWGAFTNCGQVCVGVRRLLVSTQIIEQFIERLTKRTKELRIGKDIGPLASEKQRKKVESHVKDALELGAKLICGGERPSGNNFKNGYFYLPTILSNTTREMLIENEDTFGPVVFIKEFSTEDDAINMSNNIQYDLGASVWTRNIKQGLEIAKELRTGMVWVNDVNVAFPQAPWCGYQRSGHGVELSEFAFYEYSSLKHINCDTSKDKRREWWFPYE